MNMTLNTTVDYNRTDNMLVPSEEKVGADFIHVLT